MGSYTNQKLIFHRPSASALDGGLPFGKRIGLARAGMPAQHDPFALCKGDVGG